eukprot:jgi/Ulvmu1/5270/UM022_0064.1
MVQARQVNALLRKSLAYQRKNICSNVFILCAPIIICALLGVLQTLLDNIVAGDAKCGCECIRCQTDNGTIITDSEMCNDAALGLDCLDENEDNCGPQFSDFEEITWCPISSPSRFPPLYELNNALPVAQETEEDDTDDDNDENFEAPPGSIVSFLYTRAGTSDMPTTIMQSLVRQPNLSRLVQSASASDDLQRALDGNFFAASFDFSFLEDATWDFGSSNELQTLFLDQGLLEDPITVASSCEVLRQVVESFSTGAGADLGPITFWLQQCADGVVEPVDSTDTINSALFCTWKEAEGECGTRSQHANAFDLKGTRNASLDVDIWHNDVTTIDGQAIGALKRIAKPIDRIVNSWIKAWLGEEYGNRMMSQMNMPKPASGLVLDFSSIIGPLFFVWLVQLPLPWAVVQLVYEKQKRLRTMMKIHGLENGVYILVMYLYFIVQYILYIIIMIIAGNAAQLEYFQRNTIGVQLVFYIIYGNVQVAFAFFISCFFQNARTANITTWIWVLGAGLFAAQLMDNIFAEGRWFAVLLQIIPTFGVYRGLWELGQYSFAASYKDETGMAFSDINSDGNGMLVVWITFVLQWPVFMAAAWYLEQVLDSGIGIRRHWLFPFTCSRSSKVSHSGDDVHRMLDPSALPSDVGHLADDVLREREVAYSTMPSPEVPILVRDLRKEFPPMDGNPKKVAVKNMSLKVSRGECFGLLGPNGAGKSTSINMMIGFLEATRGEAYISGLDIKQDMNSIYKVMGVCPQHDLLWDSLTGEEHLYFYARLKGLSGNGIREAVDVALHSVRLYDVRKKRSGQYSGGMKRRLSVAISLIGSPQVAYLDEPSTGLDPASRRQLWEVVQRAKQDKAVVLTTHSMEEAEGLCDRLGIFIDGRLVCLGNPKHLTARYGGYYVFTVTVSMEQEDAVHAFVKDMSPNARRTYALAGTSKYEVPCTDIELSAIFDRMTEAPEQGLSVLDWGVHNASLEDVFIRLAQQAATTDPSLGGV